MLLSAIFTLGRTERKKRKEAALFTLYLNRQRFSPLSPLSDAQKVKERKEAALTLTLYLNRQGLPIAALLFVGFALHDRKPQISDFGHRYPRVAVDRESARTCVRIYERAGLVIHWR